MSASRATGKKARGTGPAAAASPAQWAARYEQVALVLQGGGALGAYQCGVCEALQQAGIHPHWLAGTSIGAINAALLAGNAPEHRIERLQTFWREITRLGNAVAWPFEAVARAAAWLPPTQAVSAGLSAASAIGSVALGQHGFFEPRAISPLAYADGSAQATSLYDTRPLKRTLERLVDFDRINHGSVRLAVGAANIDTGNVRYFDSALEPLRAEHIMASAALPPAFPAIEIDGKAYWDGGIVSNTPLDYVLAAQPRRDSLVFQVDLWSARGLRPQTLMDVLERQKDIQYSSRTRYGTDTVAREQKLRNALGRLIESLPDGKLPAQLEADLQPWLCDRVFNIVHLIYQAKHHEEQYKDYAFGASAMREHWRSGLDDMQRTLEREDFFSVPERSLGVVTHDIHRAFAQTQTP